MSHLKEFYKDAPLFTKLAFIIPLITVFFWVLSSLIGSYHLKKRMETDFIDSNSRIIRSLALQITNDVKFSDLMQVNRNIRDFYNSDYMDYLAVYSSESQPIAIYPTQLKSTKLFSLEEKMALNASTPFIVDMFDTKDGNFFHIQSQIRDDQGSVIGSIATGGTTKWLTSAAKSQLNYFFLFGLIVLFCEICILLYLSRIITEPLFKIRKMLALANNQAPSELINGILKEPPLETYCSEASSVDMVIRKLLKTIQTHQEEMKRLAVQAGIGAVASHIAHDLRNPLATVSRFITVSKNINYPDPEFKEFAEMAAKSADRIKMIADDLLDYKKAREIKPSCVSVATLCRDTANEVAPFAKEKGIQILTVFPNNLFIKADHPKLHRVLTNIILNSAQAINHSNGIIEVLAKASENNTISFTITDNGCGILEENIPKIFDNSFSFGKPNGTGLGLSYCRNVVEAHNGIISTESEVGAGSVFTIVLPNLIMEGISPEEKVFGRAHDSQLNKWLLIEDDLEFRYTWGQVFKSCNLPPPVEITKPEAIVKMKLDYSQFKGAIVDYNFEKSGMDGIEVIKHLKNSGMNNIYFCAGCYKCDDIVEELEKIGIAGIISKPLPENVEEIIIKGATRDSKQSPLQLVV